MLNTAKRRMFILGRKLIYIFLFVLLIFVNFEAQAQTSKRIEKLMAEAKTSYSNNNYKQTIETCNRILSIEPEFSDAHLFLADVYNDLDSVKLEIFHLNKEGKTVLMVTHDYASIAKKPTRTIICADGKIEDSATNKTRIDFEDLLELNGVHDKFPQLMVDKNIHI